MTDVHPLDERIDGIAIVPDGTEEYLNPRQVVDYAEHRRRFIQWMLAEGKSPDDGEGYARRTARGRSYRANDFYEWTWDRRDTYTTTVTHADADAYMEELAYGDKAPDSKANVQKAIQTLFKWRHHAIGDEQWDPERTFSNDQSTTTSRDFLTEEERRRIREAALEYGTVPNYNGLSPDERDRWKIHLAQRYEIPKDEIGPRHFEQANGFKIPSLVFTALDCGLRPVEVERATVAWVDTERNLLRVPKEGSRKDDNEWASALTDRTARMLSRWLSERRHRPKYEGTEALWQTREGNPFTSDSLSYVLDRLCEIAGIDTTNRSLSWYSIRRSTTTYIIDESDLSTAQNQLRHKSPQTTARYDQSPPEKRRDVLDRLE
ncbi:tyrosine-type recombinase/integrase [Haloplanus natans]|uniref:tyrosine-type recombinase/integrase n=1 Tax=Haloplanus natans TaxID=376171 RepID=UPI001FE12AEC|nr:site-specific integrase [Haloplanus natans]